VTVAVGADGLLFTPPAITISTGTTVTWEWKGPNHNVVAQDPETTFDSGDPQSSGTFEYTFENAGEYPYICEPHSFQMKGYVTVVE
jgi:plastocyanin